jgi:hypothetical protein
MTAASPWKGARAFRSAGSGGFRGAPATGTEFQFSGSRGQASPRLKALMAARNYQRSRPNLQPQTSVSTSLQSPGELSALRGQYRRERRLPGDEGLPDGDGIA